LRAQGISGKNKHGDRTAWEHKLGLVRKLRNWSNFEAKISKKICVAGEKKRGKRETFRPTVRRK